MNVTVSYGSRATLHTTTQGMQRVLANNDVTVVKSLASAILPRCKAASTRVKDISYEVRV